MFKPGQAEIRIIFAGLFTPTDADRSRYATVYTFDYQKDQLSTVTGDTALQNLLGLTSTQIGNLIAYASGQMTATGGTGGIPAGLAFGLGDINGDGTGLGAAANATHLANVLKVSSPPARMLSPTTSAAYADAVLLDSPLAYWRLGESSGTTAADASGNGNTGTYAGGVTLGQTGALLSDAANTAVGFNGSSGHMSLSDAWAPAGASPRTFECWFKTTASFSTGQYQIIFGYGTDATNEAAYLFMGTDSSLGTNGFGISQYGASVGTPGVNDGNWHHGVATFDGTTWRIYLDGVLKSSSALTTNTVPGGTFDVGRSGSASYWNGSLDEIAVYGTALSADRILSHYNAGVATTPWFWNVQTRASIRTVNLRGQTTTATDGEGNLSVFLRYPEDDPDGDGQIVSSILTAKQYGLLKETRVDADPNFVMSLVGSDGDLLDFIPGIIPRTNTPGVYQDLVTRNGGGSHGCPVCSYDALGNVLSSTDARGFTTVFDRNELGEIYRITSPAPYYYKVEIFYDGNRNVVRQDTEDQQVAYESGDPTDPFYAQFMPSGNGMSGLGVAQVPTRPGPGGTLRPGWFSNLYTFDLLDNKTSQDIDATGSDPASLVTTYQYDPNQNLVMLVKPEGNLVELDYDERDLRIAQRVGYVSYAEPGAVTIWVFDANGNLLDEIGPTDRTGNAGTVLTATIADAFRSEIPLTHTGDWSLQNTYDGFNRVTKAIDAIGNFTLNTYDPGNRIVAVVGQGLIGGPSPTDNSGTGNVNLSSAESRFDEAGRMYESQQDVFLASGTTLPSSRAVTHTGGGLAANSTANSNTGTVTLTASGSSYVLTRSVFDRADRLIQTSADNTAATVFTLDGAGRVIATQDALGNQVTNTLDANGNVIGVTRTDIGTMLTVSGPETFQSAMRYDSLNRPVLAARQGADGQITSDLLLCCSDPTPASTLVTLMGYDSRNNQTLTIDPKANTTVARFDGASRQTQTLQHMRLNGSGPNPPAGNTSFLEAGRGVIRTDVILDGNGRVVELIDDRGAGTAFGYDALDRQVTLTFHDGSVRTNTFNAVSDVVAYVDENGSAFAFTLDAIGRRTAVAITPAALTSLYGTTAQSFQYDGLSRVTYSQDLASTTSIVQPYYDSLGRVLEENQNIGSVSHYVTHSAWTSYPATGFTFPSSRQLTIGFDALYRKNTINETTGGASIAAWQFFGNRIGTVTLGNGIICSFMNNAQSRSAIQAGLPTPPWGNATTDQLGFDGAGRVITKRYLLPSGGGSPGPATLVVGFTTAYDRSSNKLFERHLHAESRSHLYPAYDSPDRLLQYQRGTLATGGAGIATPITLPNTDSQRSYALDGLGNWNNTAYTPVDGSPTTEYRRHNYLNQITRYGATPVLYDHGNNAASLDPNVEARGNGNIADDGLRTYQYDALNRLSQVFRNSDGLIIANYYYDAFGRRTIRFISNGGLSGTVPNVIWTCLYDGARVVEELNGTTAVQYVWGQYVDELIQLNAVMALGPQGLTGKYYLLSDLLYRSLALTNSAGAVVEAYDTDAYGNTLLFSGPGTDGLWFTNDDVQATYSACRYVFTGREYDAETALYFYRARYYHPQLGRFVARDAAGYKDSASLYQFAVGTPTTWVDPTGFLIYLPGGSIPNPTLPLAARPPYPPAALAGLQAICPCVTINRNPNGDHIVTASASPLYPFTGGKDGDKFCDCLKAHSAGCFLIYNVMMSPMSLRLQPTWDNPRNQPPPLPGGIRILFWGPDFPGSPGEQTGTNLADTTAGGFNSQAILAHELAHAYEGMTGTLLDNAVIPSPKGYPANNPNVAPFQNESRATRVQNQVYQEVSGSAKPGQRSKYLGFDVKDWDQPIIPKCSAKQCVEMSQNLPWGTGKAPASRPSSRPK